MADAPRNTVRSRGGLFVAAAGFGVLIAQMAWWVLDRSETNDGDLALIELWTRDVFTTEPPLTGAYSRFGWSHPGPILFYLFAVPYRVAGGDADALQISALMLNAVMIGILLWIAARRSVTALVGVATSTLLLVRGLEPDALAHGWNVTATIVPIMVIGIGCWCALCGDRAALLVAVGTTVFVVQTHVGSGFVVLPLMTGVLFVAWKRRPGGAEGRRTDRSLVWCAAVLVGGCVSLVLDTLFDPPGNLGRLLRWSVTNDEPKVGIADAVRMLGRTSSLSFPLRPELPGRFFLEIETVSAGFVPGVTLIALGVATVIARRRGWRNEVLLCVVVWVLWMSALVAAALITRPLAWWLVEWLQPLGWLTWFALANVAWRVCQSAASERRASAIRHVGVALIAGTVIAGTIDHQAGVRTLGRTTTGSADAAAELADGAIEAAQGRSIRIDIDGPRLEAEAALAGLVNQLDAAGADVCVDESLLYKFRTERACGSRNSADLLLRYETFSAPAPDGARILRVVDPLTTEQRLEADRIRSDVARELTIAGRDDLISILDTPLAASVSELERSLDRPSIASDLDQLVSLRNIGSGRLTLYESA